MATERSQTPDILRLNALIDGELSPADRAEMAARLATDRDLSRAYATLAQIKACVAGQDETAIGPDPLIVPPRPSRLRWAVAVGAAAAVAGLGLFAFVNGLTTDRADVPEPARHALVVLAALPENPVVPELSLAGLKLTDVALDHSGPVRFLKATYSGRQGCRLDLRIRPADADVLPLAGTSSLSWTVGRISYDLSAHGMPSWRFTLIAEAAERQTRNGRLPEDVSRQIREARALAPPCVG